MDESDHDRLDEGIDETTFEPFVSVDAESAVIEYQTVDDDGAYAAGPDEIPARHARRRRSRLRLPRIGHPRLALDVDFQPGMLVALGVLIAGGIFGGLLKQDRVSDEAAEWWPLAGVGLAVLWLLAALIRRRVTESLGAAALAGVGLAALMETQDIARFGETLFGVMLVTLGLGIVIRGFLLRQQAPLR
jgi:hypothetical protein